MADVHTKQIRSYNMGKVKSKDTKPELLIRSFLHKNGFRYKLHDKKLPGKPDIVLPKYRTIVFIHGCFWHGHENCKRSLLPKTNAEWWERKIKGNIQNDGKVIEKLVVDGWDIIIIWTCQLKADSFTRTTESLLTKLLSRNH